MPCTTKDQLPMKVSPPKTKDVGINDNDVLCGRGGLGNKHPGNRMFRRLVGINKTTYQRSMNQSHKNFLVMSIIKAIEHHGGRFLRKQRGRWIQISDKDASVKTAQALREHQDPNNGSGASKTSVSTTSKKRHIRRVSDVSFDEGLWGGEPTPPENIQSDVSSDEGLWGGEPTPLENIQDEIQTCAADQQASSASACFLSVPSLDTSTHSSTEISVCEDDYTPLEMNVQMELFIPELHSFLSECRSCFDMGAVPAI